LPGLGGPTRPDLLLPPDRLFTTFPQLPQNTYLNLDGTHPLAA
jgi:hypothetical protein